MSVEELGIAKREAPTPVSLRRRLLFVAKLVVSVSLLAYLFSLVEPGDLKESLANFAPGFIAVAVGLLLCQSILSTFKWKIILAADGIRLHFLFLLKTYLISNFVSLFLPTSFGGDVYRVMAVRKVASNMAKTTSSVLFDRLTGLFALLSIASVSYILFSNFPAKWLVAMGYAAATAMFWLGASGWLVRRFSSTGNRIVTGLLQIFESFQTYARHRSCLLLALVISLLFQLNIVVINKVYSLSLGLDVPFTTLLVIIPLVYLTEAIPFSINGLGFREGAFVFFYQLIGETAEAGFAISLLVLMLRYTMGLVGGSLLIISVVRDRSKDAARVRETGH